MKLLVIYSSSDTFWLILFCSLSISELNKATFPSRSNMYCFCYWHSLSDFRNLAFQSFKSLVRLRTWVLKELVTLESWFSNSNTLFFKFEISESLDFIKSSNSLPRWPDDYSSFEYFILHSSISLSLKDSRSEYFLFKSSKSFEVLSSYYYNFFI